jgi:excinuclease ABC subunit B
LRSERSLIQTIGRAARNLEGRALLYADKITNSMRRAIDETERRRAKQIQFNTDNGITPKSIHKKIGDLIDGVYGGDIRDALRLEKGAAARDLRNPPVLLTEKELAKRIKETEKNMLAAAKSMDFELAATLRDELKQLKSQLFTEGL